jgi:hypothetical protein
VSWEPNASQHLRLGGEFTRHSIASYSSFLTELSFSDTYLEHPIQGALYAEDRVELSGATITAGVRYDFYNSRARRPADFPRISSNPQYNPANPDAFFSNDVLFPRDKSHGYFSPHFALMYPLNARTVFRGSVALQGQAPDFRDILQRINSDLSFMNIDAVFGTDLDFERTQQFEFGIQQAIGAGLSLDLAVYGRKLEDGVETRLVSRFDPLRQNDQNIFLLLNGREERARGVDLKLERRGALVSGWLGYSYVDAIVKQPATFFSAEDEIPSPASRPHSVTAVVAVQLPSDWQPGSFAGAILRDVELGGMFRVASGTPYTTCHNLSTLSSDDCVAPTPTTPNDARLPAFKQLDVRLAKHFGPGGRFAGYLDARNVLNFRNVLAVFAANGTTENQAERNLNWVTDSVDYASEAQANAAYRVDGSVDLGQGQVNPVPGCADWATAQGSSASPNCVYLIRAEERFGNGDHLFDLTEQRRASDALYQVVRGPQALTGPPRRIRVGLEAAF